MLLLLAGTLRVYYVAKGFARLALMACQHNLQQQ
jgi:hypothetical protein